MQPPLVHLIPWDFLLLSLVSAGLGLVYFIVWRNTRGRNKPWWLFMVSSRSVLFFPFALALAFACVFLTQKRYHSIQELSQFVEPYPRAQLVISPGEGNGKTWLFSTKDQPAEVRAFYTDLARQQKTPFQVVDDDKFLIGQGTGQISVKTGEDADGTTIFYERMGQKP
jgi:hypothetical protein